MGKVTNMKLRNLIAGVCALCGGAVSATAETVEITQVANRYPWNGKLDVAYSLAGLVSGKSYQLVTAVTVGGTTRAVTNGLGSVTDGGYTNTVDCTALFGTAVAKETASVKLSVLGYTTPAVSISTLAALNGPFLIIDLQEVNGKFVTREFARAPWEALTAEGRWTDDYKRNHIVLRKVPAGCYPGYNGVSKETAGYWIGVFEVTEAQYDRVMGSAYPSSSLVAKSNIDYVTVRGTSDASAAPGRDGFMGRLCAKCVDEAGNAVTGFDLPTEWQWNISYCAGTTTAYYWGNATADKYAWYYSSDFKKGSGTREVQVVGLKLPNAWGLYDIAGNVREWCRDAHVLKAADFTGLENADSFFSTSASYPDNRQKRGGGFNQVLSYCDRNSTTDTGGSRQDGSRYNVSTAYDGFRLCRTGAN